MFKLNLLNAAVINVTNKFQMVECVVSVMILSFYVRLCSSVVNYLCNREWDALSNHGSYLFNCSGCRSCAEWMREWWLVCFMFFMFYVDCMINRAVNTSSLYCH